MLTLSLLSWCWVLLLGVLSILGCSFVFFCNKYQEAISKSKESQSTCLSPCMTDHLPCGEDFPGYKEDLINKPLSEVTDAYFIHRSTAICYKNTGTNVTHNENCYSHYCYSPCSYSCIVVTGHSIVTHNTTVTLLNIHQCLSLGNWQS